MTIKNTLNIFFVTQLYFFYSELLLVLQLVNYIFHLFSFFYLTVLAVFYFYLLQIFALCSKVI